MKASRAVLAGFRYRKPGGHQHEIYWEAERWTPPRELAATFPDRPQRYVPQGVAVNYIDHVTVATADIMGDVGFFRDTLDYRFTEWTVLNEDTDLPVFAMVTTNEQAHDLGLLGDHSGIAGRIHHLAVSGPTSGLMSSARPTFCSRRARRSNMVPAATEWAS